MRISTKNSRGAMADPTKHAYEFGPFRIDTVERLLFRGDETVPLAPKAVDTLLALVSNHGRVLEKEELMKLIWPDSFVEEGGLTRNVSILRKVFEEGEFPYIETIPKRGYRFLAPVKEVVPPEDSPAAPAAPSPQPTPDPISTGTTRRRLAWTIAGLLVLGTIGLGYFRFAQRKAPDIKSLVVLPLQNPSNDSAQEYFTEGMTEDLINSLARIEALRVISRTSAMTYKSANKPLPQIARELNVDAVLEGSVLQSGGRVRITVQLFDKAERQLWAQEYQRDLRDVLTLQNEVARAIAGEIKVKLTPREKNSLAASRTVDPAAYLDYSYGRYYWSKRAPDDIKKAIEYFQSAITKDPNYAQPYAGLADAFAQLGSVGIDVLRPQEAMSKAKAAALQAVKLDDTLAEGHASLAYARMSYDWDLDAAQQEFQRAIELNPGYATAHHWYAHYFLARNQPEQALAEVKRAQALDPLSSLSTWV
jgi:TolB-like protein/DNA-binding winged helix-turn-helix (wHTH) protein